MSSFPRAQSGTPIAIVDHVTQEELKARTRQFAIDVIRLCLSLGWGDLPRLVRPQLLRAGSGVAFNYRATCRGRSDREFASRLGVVVEEADEAELWLDILLVFQTGDRRVVGDLRREASELRAIMSASRSTVLRRLKEKKAQKRKSRQIQ
jgi:four helix bundle protein